VLALNCCVPPSVTDGLVGEIVNVELPIVSEANAVYAGDPVAIASMEHFDPAVPLAVNNPPALIVPHVALHVTAAFAVNCCACPCAVEADAGVMLIGDVIVTVVPALPAPVVEVAVTVHEPGASGAV
jgi:hypothetical protein